MSDLSEFQRGQIVGARMVGASVTTVAQLLGVSRGTVSKVIHGTFTPSCCEEHKVACSKTKNINILRWKFPVEEDRRKAKKKVRFDPWTRVTKLHQQQKQNLKQFDDILDQLKMKGFLEQLTAALDPAVIGKVSHLLDIQLPQQEYEKVDYESLFDNMQPMSETSSLDPYDESLIHSDEGSASDQSKGSDSPSRNPYLSLLKRLRKKEMEQMFPDQELMSVKNAEEELQKATVEFCQWSKTLGQVAEKETPSSEEVEEDSDGNHSDKEQEAVFDVKSLRRMFYVAYGKPIHCPHIPTVVREPSGEPPPLLQTVKQEEEKKMHVAWYLPPNIWFKKWVEIVTAESPGYAMTPEEIALASSYTVKKYMEYLEKNHLEPPRGLVELMKKQKELQLLQNNEHEGKKTGSAKV